MENQHQVTLIHEVIIIIVHNGIIENYFTLKEFLKRKAISLIVTTDSEVVAHLLDYCYEDSEIKTINKVINLKALMLL